MSENKSNNKVEQKKAFEWTTLYKIGGIFSILTVITIVLSIISFFIWPLFPKDILQVIQINQLVGIISLDVLYLIAVLFTLPLVLVLYISLKQVSQSFSLIAIVLGVLGIVLIIPARPILEMLSLSDLYNSAATNAERLVYLSLSNTLIEQFKGTCYYLHLLFGNISFLTSSILMLKSNRYAKSIGILGIITNSLAFGMFLPKIGPFIGLVFLLGFLPWLFFIALTSLKKIS
jgi:hypothetical protein